MNLEDQRDRALRRPVHDDRTAAVLGISLAVCFGVCFLTGLYSHFLQQPPSWLDWPARPAWLYRVTQGLHVATGFATVPLLLAKLWSVYPRLFRRPPVVDVAHAIERLMLVPLVFGSVFLLFTGVGNVARWYPWGFYFPAAHYAAAWITVGALIVHVGAKARVARAALARPPRSPALVSVDPPAGALGRRGFLGAVATAAGVVTLTTAGQTVTPLRPLTLFAQRRPDIGSQGVPVNKSAVQAGVTDAATAPGFRLRVRGDVHRELELTAGELDAMAHDEVELPIACVEGWSVSARWRGVPVRTLLDAAGVDPEREIDVTVESLQGGGRFRASELNHHQARDRDTLLAVAVNGQRLNLDHGYPCRLIGPNRPGVLQTKWVTELVVRT
ncbi:DMSO/TMAO reductase YedYZ molybdopterin-dependent catalytic subunit [Haloactinopolyspora alba]|uniref:DMSO/TMAO reductase YedYZ molybdopterin-dependent catalytic subunit n=1 Tax=Haloactinopolyspora alba TaxID=648780 RepID=A0A2P8DK62_9ACTN|nr:molybdopterin-dependent oxidoreductase [Haloactinopolyspora alba]PSK97578.1 DMSO/TMAO reductase YedYZ molybdopterin-dependent catalytic subunit [Haloactinopolyspora alba]